MKYFTKEWCFSNLSDSEVEKRLKSYRDYINSIYINLPFSLKILVRNINLHDGRLLKISFINNETSLQIEGVFGDLETGYFFLKMKYSNILNLIPDNLKSIVENQEIEILIDEIEILSEKAFSHRMFFTTKREINIQFKDIEIEIRNASALDYKKFRCVFENIK